MPLLLVMGSWMPKALAQVIPDSTLAPETSQINQTNNQIVIEGGAQRGAALFHSFETFGVSQGSAVSFVSPPKTEIIIGRITGNGASLIDGTLGVLGPADLFLLNPNGILLGPDAQLSLSGDFTASTAESVRINELNFSAALPASVPSLNISVEPGLQLGANSPERLVQNQGNLVLSNQQQLSFDGGSVEHSGQIFNPGGTVALRGQRLQITGDINTRMNNGEVGQVHLLSPADITIQLAMPLTNQAIAQALQNNAVTVQAAGDLTVIGAISSPSSTSLTFTAGDQLSILPDGSGPLQLTGDVTLESGGDLRLENSLLVSAQQADPQLSFQSGQDVLLINNPLAGDAGRVLVNLEGNGGRLSIRANSFNSEGVLSTQSDATTPRGRGPEIDAAVTQDFSLLGGSAFTRAGSDQTAGDIRIQAGESVRLLDNSGITSLGLSGNTGVNTGGISIEAGNTLSLENSVILTTSEATAGKVDLSAQNIVLNGTAGQVLIASDTTELSTGNAGDITLKATEAIELIGNVPGPFNLPQLQPFTSEDVIAQSFGNTTIQASAFGVGTAGNIKVNAERLALRDGAFLSNIVGLGSVESQAGDITIDANDIQLQGLAVISTGTLGNQAAGALDIRSDRITLDNGASIGVSTALGTGNAGELTINTQELSVTGGAVVAANTIGGGSGGVLTIDARAITVEGTSPNGMLPSSLRTGTFMDSTGSGGLLRLQTETLQVLNGGQIRASTLGAGNAGNLDITADRVSVRGQSSSGLSSAIESQSAGTGVAGTLRVAANQLTVGNRAQITTGSQQGNGGDIQLQLGEVLLLRNQGQISATAGTAGNGGNGGNISIDAGVVLAPSLENSDITANAFEGSGGNINIRTRGLLGTRFRDTLTPFSDITASADSGLDGTVTIENLAENITPDRIELSAAIAESSNQLAIGCLLDEEANFVITGRGGIPAGPREVISQGLIWQDPRTATDAISEPVPLEEHSPSVIVEAQGWQRNEQGSIELFSTSGATPPLQKARCRPARRPHG
ncbi:MAG: filamentous hemagglutinin N-terminal domain-containing protein [Cyanobacteria bacterium J06634_5]